jgi:hypothetical protein
MPRLVAGVIRDIFGKHFFPDRLDGPDTAIFNWPGNWLDFRQISRMLFRMRIPTEPVTLSVEQISELNRKLSDLRHDVNNKLSLIAASVELIRRRPEIAARLLNSIDQQPKTIAGILTQFSAQVEAMLHIERP